MKPTNKNMRERHLTQLFYSLKYEFVKKRLNDKLGCLNKRAKGKPRNGP